MGEVSPRTQLSAYWPPSRSGGPVDFLLGAGQFGDGRVNTLHLVERCQDVPSLDIRELAPGHAGLLADDNPGQSRARSFGSNLRTSHASCLRRSKSFEAIVTLISWTVQLSLTVAMGHEVGPTFLGHAEVRHHRRKRGSVCLPSSRRCAWLVPHRQGSAVEGC